MARYKLYYFYESSVNTNGTYEFPEAQLEVIFNYADGLSQPSSQGLYDLLHLYDYDYRVLKGISTLGSDPDGENLYYNQTLYNQLINFINNTLIPSLENETSNILQKLGGAKQLKNNNSYFNWFLIDYDHPQFNDLDNFSPQRIINWCKTIEELLYEAVSFGEGPVFYDR